MKPFDLEAAKRGEPICTRDGETDVVFGAHNPLALESARVVVWIRGSPVGRREDGLFVIGVESYFDLFMAPKKRVYWERRLIFKSGTVEAIISQDREDAKLSDVHAASYVARWLSPAFSFEVEE